MEYRILFLFLSVFIALLSSSQGIEFRVKEKQGVVKFVGNVIKTALPHYLAKSGKSLTSEEIAALRYKFFGRGNPYVKYFTINERSGDIKTKKILNRERLCPLVDPCKLNVDVAAFNSENLVQIMRITVIVEDENDHWPEFPVTDFDIEIPESASVNATFPIPSAKDPDVGKNTVQTYKLSKENKYFNLSVIKNLADSTDLEIVVKSKLDRETRGKHEIEILAIDGGEPRKTGTMTVRVKVADINDNRPVFSKTRYNITVEENFKVGETLIQVVANDKDAGSNGKVSYSLSDRIIPSVAEKFEINREDGRITLNKKLDYETDRFYQLLVLATDNGLQTKQRSQALVIINVLDVNDNKPVINFNFLSANDAEIPESAKPGKFVAHVSVVDADSGENARVSCRLTDEINFRIDDKFQIYLKTSLDRELKDSYDVEVTCRDNGVPRKSNTAKLVVKVIDVNDNPPVFSRKTYYVSLHENNVRGEVLLQLTAIDRDIGQNGAVRYAIERDIYGFFKVNPRTGVITVDSVLDRETIASTSVVVVARDSGIPSKSATATVEVTILDRNDVTPHFDAKMLTFNVPENDGYNQSFGFVKALDDDLGSAGNFEYSLKSYDGARGLFSLSPKSGELRVAEPLDREERSQYLITIIAKDHGDPSLTGTATVTVNVLDKNDNKPKFLFPSETNRSVVVKTTAERGHFVCRLQARDPDAGPNAVISYKIEKRAPQSYFTIDSSTGVVRLRRKLRHTSSFVFTMLVSAHDQGREESKTYSELRINVTFVNVTIPPDGDESPGDTASRSDGNNVAIVVSVVVITLFLVIVLVLIICLVIRQRRRKRPSSGEDGDIDFSVPTSDPDLIKSNNRLPNAFTKRNASGNVDIIMDNKFSHNGPVNNSYLNSYDPTNSVAFLWSDTKPDTVGTSGRNENNVQQNSWGDMERDVTVAHNRDDASSDVSENTVTSDSGRGGSEEGSARGHTSMEDADSLAFLHQRQTANGDYVDMSGGRRRQKISTPGSDQLIVSPHGGYLSGRGRCSSDLNLVIGRLTPLPSDKYTDIQMSSRPFPVNQVQYVSPNNPDMLAGLYSGRQPLSESNSLDRPSKRRTPHNNLHTQLSAPSHARHESNPHGVNPYSDLTSSAQLANVNHINKNDIPGILSNRSHGSMPIRFKDGLTPHVQNVLSQKAGVNPRHYRAQKCVRFENSGVPAGSEYSSPPGGSYDDDDATTTSGSYSIDGDDLSEQENVTNV